MVLAYPMALVLFRSRSRFRGAARGRSAVAPLLVSGTARVIGWLVILGDNGLINAGLRAVGLAPVPLINNWTGVRIGLTESVMPYATLALLAGFGRLDKLLEEAAATLGAQPLRSFWHVTLPLTAGAIGAAWLLAFVLSISAFITPHLMGGGRVFVLATEIYDAATQTLDWPEVGVVRFGRDVTWRQRDQRLKTSPVQRHGLNEFTIHRSRNRRRGLDGCSLGVY